MDVPVDDRALTDKVVITHDAHRVRGGQGVQVDAWPNRRHRPLPAAAWKVRAARLSCAILAASSMLRAAEASAAPIEADHGRRACLEHDGRDGCRD